MSGPAYVWNEPDRPITVHLALDVVSRLGLKAMEAYKSVPHRGLEIGGLLLGRREGTHLFVDGFEQIDSEHRSGPSYVLSENDRSLFDGAFSAHPDAVGLYRTQTRGESLALNQGDAELFRHHFSGEDGLYLLIRPATARAAFFLPKGDSLLLAHEFPFRAGELSAEGSIEEVPLAVAPPAPEAATVPSAPVMAAAATAPPPIPAAKLKPRARSRWAIPLAAILLGMACGAAIYGFMHRANPASSTAPASQPVSAAQTEPASHVALSVQREGASLRLVWDRESPVVRSAAKAILYISDGGHQSQLNLDPRELNSGLISYWPDTKDVTFRLEVFAAGHSSDDSIRVVGGVAVPQPPPRRVAADRTPASSPAPPVIATPTVPAPPAAEPSQEQQPTQAAKEAPRSPEGSASRTDLRTESAESRPSPLTPVPKPTAGAPAAPSPAALNTPGKDPQVWVKVEPVGGSRGIIEHIPLLRRLKKQPQTFVPPAPMREVRPTLSARERHALVGMVPVDVKVYVADSGKVQFVELLSDSYRHEDLASSVVYAARRWEFSPARLGQEKVPGEVILHFRFSPEEPPLASR